MTLEEALAEGIATLGLDLDAVVQAKLLAYLELLEKWNRTHNLTSVRQPARMLSLHLLDSLAVLPHLPGASRLRLLDVGSGGGLPGIPLAIARPAWAVTLIDSNRKKCAFLRQVVAELALGNVDVVAERAETYSPPAVYDVVIARALAELADFAAKAGRLLAPQGLLVAMKGIYPAAEIDRLPPAFHVIATPSLNVPGVEGERHLVILGARPA